MPDFSNAFSSAFNANAVTGQANASQAASAVVIDKLTIINRALVATSNNPVNIDDGTDEWVTGSQAYDRMLPVLLAERNWKFQTDVTDLLRLGTSAFPGFADVYSLPANCLQFMNCWDALIGAQALPFSAGGQTNEVIRGPSFAYRLIGNHVHCNGPNGVTAMYMKYPNGSDPIGVLFAEALTTAVQGLIASGLNDDMDSAKDYARLAENQLSKASSRDAQQEPRRVPFRSQMREARRRRGGF